MNIKKKTNGVSIFKVLLNTITKYPNGMIFYIPREDKTMIRYAQGFANIYAIEFIRKNKKHNIYKIKHNNLSPNITASYIMKQSRDNVNGVLDYYVFNNL